MANWIFQYGAASLGVIADRVTFSQTMNAPTAIIPGQDGVSITAPTKRERKISIVGRLNDANTTATRDAINSLQNVLWNSGGTEKLRLHDDRHMNAYLTRFDHTWLPGVGASAISLRMDFIADHPFFVNDSSFTNLETPAVATFSFSVVNTGSAVTPPELKFAAANSLFTTVAIENLTTGGTLTIVRSTAIGDEVRVNVASFTVTDSAGANLISTVTGKFPELNPGTNSFVFTGSASDVRLTWNPRYDQ